MGAIASFQLKRADRRMEKTLVFVKCAFAGDVAAMQEMMTQQKLPPDTRDRFGMTALHWAAYGGKLLCVQELLKAGASVTIVDNNGRNALHHACRKDHKDVVRFLVTEAKMNVNALSESKDTPLHKAVIGKSIRCVEVLLQLGADPSIRNDQNRTPLEELDTDPGGLKDVLPEPIPTARMREELDTWRSQLLTEVKPSGRRRNSVEALLSPSRRWSLGELSDPQHSRSRQPTGTKHTAESRTDVREIGSTLVTSFRSRISEYSSRSDHSSRTSSAGDLSSSSRPSSAQCQINTFWAKPLPAHLQSSSVGSNSKVSTRRRDSGGKPVVLPLNLQGLNPTPAEAVTHPSSISSSVHSVADVNTTKYRRRNLRYAGKRVIMALRVKKCMTGGEKREMIRLMLLRHMKSLDENRNGVRTMGGITQPGDKSTGNAGSTAVHPSAKLERVPSAFTLSLSSN